MYIRQNVLREAGSPGAGIQPRDQLVIIATDDILYMPPRNAAGVVIEEDIVMRPGRYPVCIYMTPGTVEVTEPLEGETDQEGFTPTVKFNHPGNEQAVREFKVNNVGGKYVVLMRYCSGKAADVFGDLCNPMKLTASYTGNNDGSTNEFTFTQTVKGKGIGIYRGGIPEVEPVAVVEASATKIDYVSDGQYQLSEGTASIIAIEGGSHDSLVTLLGTAGQAPTVAADGGKIMLRGGTEFVAAEGCQITLRAFDSGSGMVWIEQSRFVQ